MKSFKYILTAAIFLSAVAATTGVSAKSKMVPRIYMFGFSASFTDSIVYFTNVRPWTVHGWRAKVTTFWDATTIPIS